MQQRVFLLGASGWIGHYLEWSLLDHDPHLDLVGTYSQHLPQANGRWLRFDYRCPDELFDFLRDFRPGIVVNLLGGEEEALFAFHQRLTGVLGEQGAFYAFMSSSMVFDADLSAPHRETDTVRATSVYGRFKERCERTVRETNLPSSIFRISATHGYAPNKVSRTERFLKKLQAGETVEVDRGVFQNRLEVSALAWMMGPLILGRAEGIFHLGTTDQSEEVTFLQNVAESFGYSRTLVVPQESTPKYLTVIPKRVFALLGEKYKLRESDTLQRIRAIPEFQSYVAS